MLRDRKAGREGVGRVPISRSASFALPSCASERLCSYRHALRSASRSSLARPSRSLIQSSRVDAALSFVLRSHARSTHSHQLVLHGRSRAQRQREGWCRVHASSAWRRSPSQLRLQRSPPRRTTPLKSSANPESGEPTRLFRVPAISGHCRIAWHNAGIVYWATTRLRGRGRRRVLLLSRRVAGTRSSGNPGRRPSCAHAQRMKHKHALCVVCNRSNSC